VGPGGERVQEPEQRARSEILGIRSDFSLNSFRRRE
jgi:hypothetical protein